MKLFRDRKQESEEKTMLMIAMALLVAVLVGACGHAQTELGELLGCHLAGNGCPSVNMDDPNLRGLTGPVGPQGPQGVPGERGPVGPGEEFFFVQFCPDVVPEYTSAFPEVGICVGPEGNRNLYAVYSQNNGFLTLLPAGRYSSYAVGSHCSFTVRANCEVVP